MAAVSVKRSISLLVYFKSVKNWKYVSQKKQSKTKQNDQKKGGKKKSGGSRISKPTNKNNSCTQFEREGVGLRPIYNEERTLLTKNLLKRF